MKIGLFFGSFNPVHTGHLIIANHIATFRDFDKIWFVISPQNPLKKQRSLLNEYHRKHLIDISIEGENKLQSSGIEFTLPKPSYTIDTLIYLTEKYPDNQFQLIIGSDSYINFKKWKNYNLILENYGILIYNRPNYPVEESLHNNVSLVNAPLLEISSTDIRNRIKDDLSIRYLVPDVVKEEIERNHYYR